MILGITFEEKILQEIPLDEYMNLIHSCGISLLEFAPNFINYDIGFYKKITKKIKMNSIQYSFHLPSFIDENLSVDNFNEDKQESLINYFEKLDQVFDLTNNSTSLVFHGAKYEKTKKSEAMNKTILFIEFLIELFLKKKYHMTLAIETLNKNKYNIIGDSRKDIENILNQIDSPKLKICWDITHDYLNHGDILYPKGRFLKAINHCHIHGYKDNTSHLSLSDNPQLFPAIKFAKKNNIPINIELLMQENYLDILKKDILTIQSIN
ncbi:MAG TPA: TIM barrel protein [Clostridia bacterium]|nr:TIM barrel protein [Clostridia bacterium]